MKTTLNDPELGALALGLVGAIECAIREGLSEEEFLKVAGVVYKMRWLKHHPELPPYWEPQP